MEYFLRGLGILITLILCAIGVVSLIRFPIFILQIIEFFNLKRNFWNLWDESTRKDFIKTDLLFPIFGIIITLPFIIVFIYILGVINSGK